MAFNKKVLFQVDMDASQLLAETNKLISRFAQIKKAIETLGGPKENARVSALIGQLDNLKVSQQALKSIDQLEQRINRIREAQAKAAAGEKFTLKARDAYMRQYAPGDAAGDRLLTEKQGAAQLEVLNSKLLQVKQGFLENVAVIQNFGNALEEEIGVADKAMAALQRRIDLIASGKGIDRFVRGARATTAREIGDLSELRGQLIARAAAEVPGRGGLEDVARLDRTRREIISLESKVERTIALIAKMQKSQREATEEGDDVGVAKFERRIQNLTELLKAYQEQLGSARERKELFDKAVNRIIDKAGIRDQIDQIDRLLGTLDKVQQSIATSGIKSPQLAGAEPALESIRASAQVLKNELNAGNVPLEKRAEITARITQLEKEASELLQSQQQSLSGINTLKGAGVEQLESGRTGGFGRLDRLLFGATEDFTRRFITTFQYAFSGAIQFAALRAIKEFGKIAVQAERQFQDIATNLEFDIEAERGTGAFTAQLEKVRQNVFTVANELNILPSVASKSAYVMVARFGDVNRALLATRAQLLATQVSGIDQAEVLRALTAVAESFATSITDTNSALTSQERLLSRERNAVILYGKALDYAVRIQQLYGIETEDSLEGVARSAETFKALGFSVEETFAIVASVSRKLGQQGVTVAERLNRSIGQITSPEISGALLKIARESENLNLTIADFEDGSKALATLVDQYRQLESVEPETAQRVLQELGQRREAEVVAAVLDTGDLQSQIKADLETAAGSAEDRYKVLKETVVELLESLNAQFETLATNIGKLGAITPFKLFIKSLDSILTLLNEVLNGLNTFKETLNAFGNTGLGDLLVTTLSLGLALKSIAGIFGTLTGRFPAINTAIGSAFGAADSLRLLNTQKLKAGLDAFQASLAGGATTMTSFKAGISAAGLSVGALALGFAALVAAIGITVSAIKQLNDAINDAKRVNQDIVDSEADIIRDQARGGLTPEEANIKKIESSIDIIEQTSGDLGSSLRLIVSVFEFAAQKISAGPDTSIRPSVLRDLYAQGPVAVPVDARALIPGSEEYYAQQVANVVEEGFEAYFAGIQDQLNQIFELDPEGYSDRPGTTTGDIIRRSQTIFGRLTTVTDPEERRELLAQLAVLYVESEAERLRLLEEQFQVEGTSAQILEEANRIFDDLQLGAIGFAEASEEINTRVKELTQLYEREANKPGGEQVFEDLKQAIQKSNDAIKFRLDQETEFTDSIAEAFGATTQRPQLRAQISALDRAIGRIVQGGVNQFERGALAELLKARDRAVNDLIRATNEETIRLGQSAVSNARTDAEYFNAVQELIRAYRQILQDQLVRMNNALGAALQIPGAFAAILASMNELTIGINESIDALERAAAERAFQSGVALKRIQAIRKYKPLDPMAQIEGELAEVYAQRSRAFENEAARLENLNRERVLIAQQNQLLLQVWSGQVLSTVRVGDSLTRLKAQITIANAEIERVVRDVGTTSVEYWQAVQNYNELLNALYEQELALENYRNILGLTDISSGYQLAAAALQDIVNKLANPNLGELERAQLEVERKRAELAKESAYFNSELLNAQFAFESGDLSESSYIQFLKNLLSQVDTTTEQGKQLWLQINGLIEGLENDVTDLAFNIPDQIRLPTLFEIRRAVEADQLGVNYLDNRQQEINIGVSNELDLIAVLNAIDSVFGSNLESQAKRYAPGSAGITIGGF